MLVFEWILALLVSTVTPEMSCSKPIKAISFAEIIHGRDSSMRVTHDGFIYAVDLVMVVTGLDRNHSGNALRRVIDRNLLSLNLSERNTGGKGNSNTKLINLKEALQLVMVLPGEMAKTVRVQISEIMTDFFKGEESIVDQVRANAASNSPICQLARACDPVEDHEARHKRIKREDLELSKLEQDMEEQRASTQEKRVKTFQSALALLTQLNPDWQKTDTRFRLQTEDMVKNIIMQPMTRASLAITNHEGPEPLRPASLSISQLAQELGCKRLNHADLCRAGALAAKRYRVAHGIEPSKHRQWVDGAERVVNSYTEADRDLLTSVLTDVGVMQSDHDSICSSGTYDRD